MAKLTCKFPRLMTISQKYKDLFASFIPGLISGFIIIFLGILIFYFQHKGSGHDLFSQLAHNPFFYFSLTIPFILGKLLSRKQLTTNNAYTISEGNLIHQYFSQWINSLYDGTIILNADFDIVKWNKKAELILRSSGKIRQGNPLISFIPAQTVSQLQELSQNQDVAATIFNLPAGPWGQANVRLGITLAKLKTSAKPVFLLLVHDLQTSDETLSEIQKAQQYSQSIIDCSSEMIISADLDRCITEFNHAAEKGFGFSKEEVMGKPVSILYDDIEQSEEVNVTLNDRGIVTREIRNRKKSGEIFYSILSASILRDSQGKPTGYMGLSRDISRERESEMILKENEERFRSLCTSSPVGIIQTDSQGNCIYCNDQWLGLSGLSQDQSHLLGWMYAFVPEDRESLKNFFLSNTSNIHLKQWELRLKNAQNKQKWAQFRTSIIQLPNGKKVGYVHTVEDITERKWAEAELTKDRRFLRQIVSDAPVAMAMFDQNLTFISTSQKWLDDHPSHIPNLNGVSFQRAYTEFSERFRTILLLGLQGETLSNPEELFINKNGSKKYLRWAITPISYKGSGIDGVILVTSDVTDIIHARETAIEAAKIKSQFLANMSHEIRTPMNGVIGVTDLLLGTPVTVEQKSLINIIRSSAETLLRIIDDILDVSKIEANKIEIENHPFNLIQSIKETFFLLETKSQSKNIDFTYSISPDCPQFIVGDMHRLKQILMNLLGNALKFTESGSVKLFLSSIQKSGEIHQFHFTISDTGPGIPKEKMNRLFQPFSQIDSSITRQFGGTGLGLVISKRFIELMGGSITVMNKNEGGVEFIFDIPFEVLSNHGLNTHLQKCESSEIDRNFSFKYPLDILVVEDNEVNQKIISLYLTEMGYKPDLVSSGVECLEVVRKKKYGLILMDIQMPGQDGIQTMKMIFDNNLLINCKIVALTANARSEDKEQCLKEGFSDYLTKPLRAATLQTMIEKHFSHLKKTEKQVIDLDNSFWQEILNMQKQGQKGLVGETIDLFLQHADEQINQLFLAIERNDQSLILTHAHALRGGAINFGASEFSLLCEQLEYSDGKTNIHDQQEIYQKLKSEHELLTAELAKIKNSFP